MNIDQKARKFKELNLLWLLRGLVAFHKYAVPALLLFVFLSSLAIDSAWYANNFYKLSETMGYGIYLLVFLFVDAIIRDKCMWHFASLTGLMSCCAINLIYEGDNGDNYRYVFTQSLLGLFSFVVVALMYFEKNKKPEIVIPLK